MRIRRRATRSANSDLEERTGPSSWSRPLRKGRFAHHATGRKRRCEHSADRNPPAACGLTSGAPLPRPACQPRLKESGAAGCAPLLGFAPPAHLARSGAMNHERTPPNDTEVGLPGAGRPLSPTRTRRALRVVAGASANWYFLRPPRSRL